jgi:hypothetical protein
MLRTHVSVSSKICPLFALLYSIISYFSVSCSPLSSCLLGLIKKCLCYSFGRNDRVYSAPLLPSFCRFWFCFQLPAWRRASSYIKVVVVLAIPLGKEFNRQTYSFPETGVLREIHLPFLGTLLGLLVFNTSIIGRASGFQSRNHIYFL